MSNYKIIVYFFYIILILIAAYIIYEQPFGVARQYRHGFRRFVLKDKLLNEALRAKNALYNDNLENLLQNAGYPLGLNCIRFMILRYSIFLLFIFLILSNWLLLGNSLLFNYLIIAILFFVSTSPLLATSPLTLLLHRLEHNRLQEKNKELFSLFSMIENDFILHNDGSTTMYSLLLKLQPYYTLIKPSLGKAILHWRDGPDVAFDAFAKDIGTNEAKDLANILVSVEATSPKEALDILQSRREIFLTMRHEAYRRSQKNRGVRDYIITFAAATFAVMNIIILFYQEYRELMKFVSQN